MHTLQELLQPGDLLPQRRHVLRDPLHMVPGIYPFREEWFRQFLEAISVPTLVIWGQESWYTEEIRQQRSATIKDARVETLPGGHMLPYDSPAALGELIAEHLGLAT